MDAGRRARAALEAEVADRVGARGVRSAREALAALLEVTGLGDDVRTRRVPLPPAGL